MAETTPAQGGDNKFLTSPGEMGAMMLAHDWSATPLGPLAAWPSSLKTAVSLMLSSRQPMWIGWGDQATFLYNDAYIDVLSLAKHPWALGRPAAEVWSEIWHICGPLADAVFNAGEATMADDVCLFMNRGDMLEETYFSFSYSPIRDESGNVAGLFCPNLNVTATHLNARRLHSLSELANRALTENSVDAACTSAMTTLAAYPADLPFALIYLAGDDDNLQSPRLVQASHPALAADGAAPCMLAGGGAGAFPVAEVLRTASARQVDLADIDALPPGPAGQRLKQAMVLPLLGGSGQALGVLVAGASAALRLDDAYRSYFELVATQVATAVQNARASEDASSRLALLAEVDRAKTLFFSNVSHEFRTPLTLMLGPIEEALGEDTGLDRPQRERLQLVQRNALRLQKLVNTLLEFSRVQAGRAQAEFMPVDLAALTAELAGNFRSTIEAGGVALVVDCAPFPPGAQVYVDPAMWEKIILNLLSNAFKFTFEGRIEVSARVEDGQAVVSVADSGSGIAADEMARLFERFHRISGSAARTHEGSGIGLALVHDLVGLHGGTIDAESTPGEGTRFRIRLPLGRAHLDPAHVREDAGAALPAAAVLGYVAEAEGWTGAAPHDVQDDDGVATQPGLELERVLVADDNADMRDYLRRLFGQRWQVEVVSDGEAALAALRARPPSVIVSDVMMPRLDGFGLLAAVRADDATRDLPLVLLSARAGEEARVEGLAAGADDYIVKPFSGRELVARIESLLLRRRVRAVEQAAAQRLQAIFAQAPVAIAILRGPRLVFEQANSYYHALVGRHGLVGLPLLDAMPELEGQDTVELLNTVMASGEPYVGRSVRSKLRPGSGAAAEERFFDFVYQPLVDANGVPEGVAVVAFEVTELASAKRAADAANLAKDEFLAMLGHELRNPLAPIVTALQLMRLRGVDAAHKERDIIERQTRHLVALVDDLLDVARVAQGKIVLHKTRVEIADVIARAIETASPLIEQKRHVLEVDVPVRGLVVEADASRLAQAVANVLTNAAKYTEEGGLLRIVAESAQEDVVITIIDNGIGMAPATLPNIFDMFVQERQALSRSQGGLGLGLAIVKSMLALHGGSVTASSDGAGRGSRFVLRVPAAGAGVDVEQAPKVAMDAVGDALAVPGSGLSVLVVDDNRDAARVLGEMLALQGHEVELAFDGPSAIEKARRFQPDVGLLDIGLPGMDGYELAQALRQDAGSAPMRLFAITGYGQESDRQRARDAGFDRHLVKPVGLEQLEAALKA